LATLTATAQPKYQDGVGPLPAGFDYAEFNNLNSVKELMDDETAAIIVEPIQGEGGIHPATRNFLEGLRELCDEHGAVLVFDEVWTGVGRTGKWFAHQHYNVRPDIMTLAKGIGGGAVLAAVVATPETAKRLTPGMHASTFGGSPLATAAGNAVFEIIEEESLLGNATVRGKQLLDGLEAMEKKSDLIKQVRGLGLMAGVQLSVPGAKVVEAALQHGLLINCTQETIIRFAPALTVTEDEVNEGLNRFARALRDAVEG
jgi:acetylornithine/succinyldiaminopimelate/putrescine aminotransferase